MPTNQTLSRHKLILDRLRRSPASRDEIFEYLAAKADAEHEAERNSRSTFERDKAAILKNYGIQIHYRASDGKYIIDDNGPENTGLRLLEAFDLMNLLRNADGHAGHMILDTRRPAGTEHFSSLEAAIREQREVRFDYFKYDQGSLSERKVKPYALKEFRGRWYLLAQQGEEQELKTYGLDRMSGIGILKRKFKRTLDFDATAHYRDYFGITRQHDGAALQDIELWFDRLQGAYVKSLPLHASQELISEDERGIRIRLRLYITHDFVMELLSYGASMRVIAPEALRERVLREFGAALNLYNDEGL
jgi:predicted DNA-binding transcriptional regulator YafY